MMCRRILRRLKCGLTPTVTVAFCTIPVLEFFRDSATRVAGKEDSGSGSADEEQRCWSPAVDSELRL